MHSCHVSPSSLTASQSNCSSTLCHHGYSILNLVYPLFHTGSRSRLEPHLGWLVRAAQRVLAPREPSHSNALHSVHILQASIRSSKSYTYESFPDSHSVAPYLLSCLCSAFQLFPLLWRSTHPPAPISLPPRLSHAEENQQWCVEDKSQT